MTRLSGEQIRSLGETLSGALNINELESVVHASTNHQLYADFVGPGLPLVSTIRKLLQSLEEQGMTRSFLTYVYGIRRVNRPDVAEAIKTAFPEAETPDPEVKSQPPDLLLNEQTPDWPQPALETSPQAHAALIEDALAGTPSGKSVLVIDVGGTSVKILASGQSGIRSFPSGPMLTPGQMVASVKKLAADWTYEVVSIGYPGPVLGGRPTVDPSNLGRGWVGFDFGAAFGRPVKVVNDAALQAMGSYEGGKMLFLSLGTGLGTALIVDGEVEPMELGHLPYKKSTYENYVGHAGLERDGKKKWRRHVADLVERLTAALQPDETVIGGGNVKQLNTLPPRCRAGDNTNAFRGGFRLWANDNSVPPDLPPGRSRSNRKA